MLAYCLSSTTRCGCGLAYRSKRMWVWFRTHAHKNASKNFILDVGMEKQELGWRVFVLPIPAFHHCEIL